MKFINGHLKKFFDKIFHLHLQSSEDTVVGLKQEALDKVTEVNTTLKKAGKLQHQVMQKTTTYYLGKAAGIIR